MRPRISIRGFVRPSVGPSVGPSVRPSVGPSVRYACAKTAVFGRFRPRRDPTLNLLRDKHDLRASITTLVVPSVCLSICQSICVTWSIYAETQSGRIVASSGLFPVLLRFKIQLKPAITNVNGLTNCICYTIGGFLLLPSKKYKEIDMKGPSY